MHVHLDNVNHQVTVKFFGMIATTTMAAGELPFNLLIREASDPRTPRAIEMVKYAWGHPTTATTAATDVLGAAPVT